VARDASRQFLVPSSRFEVARFSGYLRLFARICACWGKNIELAGMGRIGRMAAKSGLYGVSPYHKNGERPVKTGDYEKWRLKMPVKTLFDALRERDTATMLNAECGMQNAD